MKEEVKTIFDELVDMIARRAEITISSEDNMKWRFADETDSVLADILLLALLIESQDASQMRETLRMIEAAVAAQILWGTLE